ncbi:Uncharacterised protein [Collinsella intestinalis]|nr:Uncharacterised protein [Collinsella intestinalis]
MAGPRRFSSPSRPNGAAVRRRQRRRASPHTSSSPVWHSPAPLRGQRALGRARTERGPRRARGWKPVPGPARGQQRQPDARAAPAPAPEPQRPRRPGRSSGPPRMQIPARARPYEPPGTRARPSTALPTRAARPTSAHSERRRRSGPRGGRCARRAPRASSRIRGGPGACRRSRAPGADRLRCASPARRHPAQSARGKGGRPPRTGEPPRRARPPPRASHRTARREGPRSRPCIRRGCARSGRA